MKRNLSPIVLFVYNRLSHTKKTIEALKNNELAILSDLIIYSDGPKNEEKNSIVQVNEVRNYLNNINGFKSIKIIKQKKNEGLSKSIISGVSNTVNLYGKVIVLEDDIVTSKYFLRFMNESLSFYEANHNIYGVTGYAYPINSKKLPSTFFLKDEGCWGWGTWDRAWLNFEKNPKKLIKSFDKKMIYDFNFNDSTNIWIQVIQNSKGIIDTWAVFWYATIFLNNGLFLHPRESFVKNIGHDFSGTNCIETSDYDVDLLEVYDIKFNDVIVESSMARDLHIQYFNSLKISIFRRLINKIFKILNYDRKYN